MGVGWGRRERLVSQTVAPHATCWFASSTDCMSRLLSSYGACEQLRDTVPREQDHLPVASCYPGETVKMEQRCADVRCHLLQLASEVLHLGLGLVRLGELALGFANGS